MRGYARKPKTVTIRGIKGVTFSTITMECGHVVERHVGDKRKLRCTECPKRRGS